MSKRKEATGANPVAKTTGESDAPIDYKIFAMTNDSSSKIDCGGEEPKPVLSKKRWHILIAVCILGVSLALQNTGPLLNLMLELIGLEVDMYLYIGLIFNYLNALFAMPAVVIVDRLGLRVAIHIAAGLFVMSSMTTSLLYFNQLPGWQHYKMFVYILTSVFKTSMFAIFALLPLKISETWFPASERSFAWTLMFHEAAIGNCITCLIYPRAINNTSDFYILAYVGLASALVSMISCIVLVTKSEPAVAPSKRAVFQDRVPLFTSLKRVLKRRDILLHLLHGCLFASINLTFGAVLQNILFSAGQSQVFTGDYMLINSLISVALSLVMSSFVHKIKSTLQACKIGAIFQTAAFIVKLVAVINAAPGSVLIGISVFLTIVGSYTAPLKNEMTADLVSGAVSKPTITGFSLVVMPVLIGIVQSTFARLIVKLEDKNDYFNALVFLIGVSAINEIVYQLFFWGKELRETSDEEHQSEPVPKV